MSLLNSPSAVPNVLTIHRDKGVFVNRPAHSVTAKLRHYAESPTFDLRLYNSSYDVERPVGLRRSDGVVQRGPCTSGQRASKLCNILFTYELCRRLEGSGVTVNALHPGLVRTNIARNNGLLGRMVNFFIGARGGDASNGAETLNYLATSPEVEGVSGKFFVDCLAVPSSVLSYDAGLASDLWELSERLTVRGARAKGE